MLVVDITKRYSMNQIKQHKWVIQGEPYQFLTEEDEFGFAEHHGGENGVCVYNERVLEQIECLNEDKREVIQVNPISFSMMPFHSDESSYEIS